jgi:pyruvate dehydrogenase E1 component beta subunit
VLVDESPPRCSLAADVAALVADKGFKSLKAPIKAVTCPHTPVPFAPNLEDEYMPNPRRIEAAVRAVMKYD